MFSRTWREVGVEVGTEVEEDTLLAMNLIVIDTEETEKRRDVDQAQEIADQAPARRDKVTEIDRDAEGVQEAEVNHPGPEDPRRRLKRGAMISMKRKSRVLLH